MIMMIIPTRVDVYTAGERNESAEKRIEPDKGMYELLNQFKKKKRSSEQKSIYKLLFTCNSAPAYAAAEGLHFKGVWIRDLLHFDCRRLWRGLFNTLAARHSAFGNQRMSKRHERRRRKVQLIDDLSFKTIFQNLSHSVTLKK